MPKLASAVHHLALWWLLTPLMPEALADTLVVNPEGAGDVSTVTMEVSDDITGDQTEQTLPVNVAPPVSPEGMALQAGDQYVDIQLSEEQCSVDLKVNMSDGSEAVMERMDVCGLDGITVEEALIPSNDPNGPPP